MSSVSSPTAEPADADRGGTAPSADAALPATLTDTVRALRERRISSVEVVTAALAAAERSADLGVAVTLLADTALAAARAADDALVRGDAPGPLHGVPVGVKDIIFTREAPTTAQSLVERRYPGDDADAVTVARLRAAGAVINAKATTMEFACGFPQPGRFPVPRNPWQPTRWPGGSSSGSGSGVAVGAFLGALGTDTVGSIRIPSAFCGITGLKPTYGRVPRSGVIPLAHSLDTVGPMARSAADCALLLGVLAGADGGDPASVAADAPAPVLDGRLAGLRVGVFHDGADDPAVTAAVAEAAAVLAACGAHLVEVELPLLREVSAAAAIIVGGEASAFHHATLRDSPELYGPYTRFAVGGGHRHSAADYVQAQRVRALGQAAVAGTFERCDAVLLSTATAGPPLLAEVEDKMGVLFGHTTYWSSLGLPAISVPGGFTPDGLPIGLQIAGRALDEATVLRIADAYQRHTDWHLRVPTTPAPAEATAAATPPEARHDGAPRAATLLHALAESTDAEPAVAFTARPGTATGS